MVGYIDNKHRVLKEWYRLFRQRHHYLSIEDRRHWRCLENTYQLIDDHSIFNQYCTSLKEIFEEYHLFFEDNLYLNRSTCDSLGLSMDCYRLIFINGKLSFELSDKVLDPWILKVDNSSHRYKIAESIYPTVFLYLIECLSDSVIHIKLPKNQITKKPLYLLHINSGSDISNKLVTSHCYHYLEIEQDSDANVIEHFVSLNDYKHFSGTRMFISLKNRSKLDYVKLMFENQSSYHISHQDIDLNQYSHINNSIFIILGPKYTCHHINSRINHKQSFLSLNSLTCLSKKDIGKIYTYVEHNNKDYATSKQLHKIIANDRSTGIFNGLIKVQKKSFKTNGTMINNNLLLNKFSSIYSIPKLEIYSDSVQCSHGATIGYINYDHVFYLTTRGIMTKDACNMLKYAFTMEIVKKIKYKSLQKIISSRINKALLNNIL